MAKRLSKAVAVAAVSLLCLPLGACGGNVAGGNPDALDNITPEESAVLGYGDAVENTPSDFEYANATDVQPVADTDIPVEPPKSGEYDGAYIWDGDLVAAGWGDTEDNKTPAPDGYVLVDNEEENIHTISIQNATAFAYFAHEASLVENDGFKDFTVNLDCDIDLGGEANLWIPASFTSRGHATDETDGKTVMFKGVFDGNGHTLYNFSSKKFYDGIRYDGTNASIYVSDSLSVLFAIDKGEYLYGLFAAAGNAVFKNLNIVDISFDFAKKELGGVTFVADTVGSVVAYVAGDCTIQNITVGSDGSEESKGNGNDAILHSACTGGIVGRVYAGKRDGKPAGGITPTNNKIAAGCRLGEIYAENCTSYVDLGAAGDGEKKGGIIGYTVYHAVSVYDNCVNYGNIHGVFAGGMTSYFQVTGSIYCYEDTPDQPINYTYIFENCVNHGDITAQIKNPADGSWIGGIIGAINDYLNNAAALYNKTIGFYDCFNYGTITTHQLKTAGGIIGRLEANANADTDNYLLEFNRVFNYGDVVGYNGEGTGSDIAAGGIFGTIANMPAGHKDQITVAVGNCGTVTGKVSGGVVGKGAEHLEKCTVKYLIDAYKKN